MENKVKLVYEIPKLIISEFNISNIISSSLPDINGGTGFFN